MDNRGDYRLLARAFQIVWLDLTGSYWRLSSYVILALAGNSSRPRRNSGRDPRLNGDDESACQIIQRDGLDLFRAWAAGDAAGVGGQADGAYAH